MHNAKLTFIGAGNMARSLIGGLIADGYPATNLRVSDPDASQLERLTHQFGIHAGSDNIAAVTDADVVVLAVKPQSMRGVASGIAAAVRQHTPLVVSIAAGIREPDLQSWLGGGQAIVRTMPNTPALVQSGATALFANQQVSEEQRDLAESILRAVGLTLWLDQEEQMDAVTALSGSGPAYFFLFMEILQERARALGLPPDSARLLTLQTAFGAAKMALESDEEVSVLRERVTSPGGTTEQALNTLLDGGIRELLDKALVAARDRSRELAEQFGREQ